MDQAAKEALRKKELNRLTQICGKMPEAQKRLIEGLKNEAAFMRATLAELQETIETEGTTDLFEQGEQTMIREHPAVKSYNAMIKNYTAVIGKLLDQLPEGKPKGKDEDELANWTKGRKRRP